MCAFNDQIGVTLNPVLFGWLQRFDFPTDLKNHFEMTHEIREFGCLRIVLSIVSEIRLYADSTISNCSFSQMVDFGAEMTSS